MVKDNRKSARIDYIDLMKGVCITLVVIMHCEVAFSLEIVNSMLRNLRMPLYFFLTGLFFKEYNGFREFIIKKTNRLVIPYIFFSYIPWIFFDCFFNTELNKTWIYYFFMLVEPYNYPLWFLRSLFISYLLFYMIHRISKKFGIGWSVFLVLVLSYVSWRVSFILPNGGWSYLLKNFVTSVFALPFIFVASYAREKGILTRNFTWKQLAKLFVLGFIIWMICTQHNVYFMKAHFGDVFPLVYFCALGGITCLWVICLILKRLFFFSYVGRYSIIVLGTHAPICHFFSVFFGLKGLILALITMALMPIMIYICIRFFPAFTAQKDLIKY